MKTWKEIGAGIYASWVAKRYETIRKDAEVHQAKWLKKIIRRGASTAFGKEHGFNGIYNYETYKKHVPLQTYEDIKPYIERIIQGEYNVLWPGRPMYFAKTSGTTSGVKYIPISSESMPYHIQAARDMLLLYIHRSGNTSFLKGKMIFLQGSPALEKKGGIPTGRLSGIAAHYVPKYLQKNRLPSWKTNMIEDWETKVDKIIDEILPENMTLFSGIPSWIQHLFEKIIVKTGKKIGEVFPNFSLFVHGGVNFDPYRKTFYELVGHQPDTLETYPASEGFIAFQDDYKKDNLLLLTDHGIFYEFVPLEELEKENPTRLCLSAVEKNKDYALVLNTNAGLYGYIIGDTVRFTSLQPYKIKVTGRINHYISAFGEHVIAKEVETAIKEVTDEMNVKVKEFSVAPQITPDDGLPYHEWLVEFEEIPGNLKDFILSIDRKMQEQNIYYKDLVQGGILRPAVLSIVKRNGFNTYMADEGKLGGQNKIPKLKNDRSLADKMYELDLIEKIIK